MSYVTFKVVKTVIGVRESQTAARKQLRAKGSRKKEKQVQRYFSGGKKGQDGYNIIREG